MKKWTEVSHQAYQRTDGPCEMCVWEHNGWCFATVLNIDKHTFLHRSGHAKSFHAAKCAAVKAAWGLSGMSKEEVLLRAVHNAEGGK